MNLSPRAKKRFIILKIISNSPYSQVVLCNDRVLHKIVVTKTILENGELESRITKDMSAKTSSVLVYDTITDDGITIIVMEYIKGDTLLDYIQDVEQITLIDILLIYIPIIKTIKCLHANNIVHRDLKLENIMLKNVPVLIDYGFSTFATKPLTRSCGSVRYCAPEIILGNTYDGKKADIFSLGVILYAMVHKKFPFKGETSTICKEPIYKKLLHKKIKKLIQQMLLKIPKNRPTIDDVYVTLIKLYTELSISIPNYTSMIKQIENLKHVIK